MENGKKEFTAWDKINLVRGFDDGRITSTEKFVLLIIATHLGGNDFAWLSLTTLMRECSQSRGVLNNNIKKLVEKGYLTKISPGDGYKSCRFIIEFENLSSTETVLEPVDNSGSLVRKPYQTGTETVLDWYGNRTRLVRKPYPNRNIKEKEKKDKREEPLSLFDFQPSSKAHELCLSKNLDPQFMYEKFIDIFESKNLDPDLWESKFVSFICNERPKGA